MGAHLLILPLIFFLICVSFILLQHYYQKWRLKELMRRKREAAKVSLVNIMQLTNSTLVTPPWGAVNEKLRKISKDGDLPSYSQLKAIEAGETGHTNVLSSLVTLREEQDSPPPYEQLYNDAKGRAVFCRYPYPCGAVPIEVLSPPPTTPAVPQTSRTVGNKPRENQAFVEEKGSSHCTSPCLLQVPQQQQPSNHLVPEPSLERRNSSAVLYL